MCRVTDTKTFIEKALLIHTGNTVDNYVKVDYFNSTTKVCIICHIHEEYFQTPHDHLSRYGCKKCGYELGGKKRAITREEFIRRALLVHTGNTVDNYIKVDYVNFTTKV